MRALAWGPRLGRGPEYAPSHGHLKRFVPKIRTPVADKRKILEQRRRLRQRIQSHLDRAKLRLARSPNSGSYAKETGLRRYMVGNTKIGGSDIDLPFILTDRSGEDLELRALLDLFEGFVRKSYPRSKVMRTKSSIKLVFSSFKYPFDIVPMVAVRGDAKREYLFRADGVKVATSVSEHVKFVKHRTVLSTKMPGIVSFNDMVRLFKWWAQLRTIGDDLLVDVPTFILELLCAKAFDVHGVSKSYTQTLRGWFGAIAEIVATRSEVRFDGGRGLDGAAARWVVLDPVNSDNNVVPARWTDAHIDRLATWFADGEQTIRRVQEHDGNDNGKGSLRELEKLFGPAVGNFDLLDSDSLV